MKFMKQILLATVSAMLLLVFASAADLPIVEDYATPDCGISTDDYEAVPTAVDVVEGLEWEDIPTWEKVTRMKLTFLRVKREVLHFRFIISFPLQARRLTPMEPPSKVSRNISMSICRICATIIPKTQKTPTLWMIRW